MISDTILRNPAYRRALGISMFVPADAARAHLLKLKGAPYYMSNARIGELAGLSESNLSQIISGKRGPARGHEEVNEVHRDTEAAILAVCPEVDHPERGGAHVDPTGARRRLQALIAAGFPMRYLGAMMGWGKDPQPVHRLVTGKSGSKYVFHSTHKKACEVYDALKGTTPEEEGIPNVSIGRAKGSAVRNGFAPAHCWDPDTIDDPDAYPEWTGACGTHRGRLIHKREGTPVCGPCKAAPEAARKFSPEKFKAARVRRGLTLLKLAEAVDCHETTVRYWEDGRSVPRRRGLMDRMLSVLDVTIEDITEEEE